jgi:nucleotide-binding universal stress UspA family protein
LRAAGLKVGQVAGADEPVVLILAAAASAGADLIVMATHGRTGVDRWLHGSVAGAVLQRAAVPILQVRCGMSPIWTPGGPLRLVVPLDGSPLAERSLPVVGQLAGRVAVDAALLRGLPSSGGTAVASGGPAEPAADAGDAGVGALRYLEGAAVRLRAAAVARSARARSDHRGLRLRDGAGEGPLLWPPDIRVFPEGGLPVRAIASSVGSACGKGHRGGVRWTWAERSSLGGRRSRWRGSDASP